MDMDARCSRYNFLSRFWHLMFYGICCSYKYAIVSFMLHGIVALSRNLVIFRLLLSFFLQHLPIVQFHWAHHVRQSCTFMRAWCLDHVVGMTNLGNFIALNQLNLCRSWRCYISFAILFKKIKWTADVSVFIYFRNSTTTLINLLVFLAWLLHRLLEKVMAFCNKCFVPGQPGQCSVLISAASNCTNFQLFSHISN